MFKRIDWILLLSLMALLVMGFAVLYSAAYRMEFSDVTKNYFTKQVIWVCLGLIAVLLLSFVNYKSIGNISVILYLLNVLLLLYVLFLGTKIGGARRWISIGIVSIQPSEFMKLTLILSLAWFLGVARGRENSLWTLVLSLLITGVPLLLILKEPDLGTALVLIPVMLTLLFIYGLRLKYFIALILTGLLSSPLVWLILKPYQKSRILVFLNPSHYQYGAGWAVIQSKIAIGSGQIFGKGWLEGTQSQLNFLPERHTDFIFAVLAEEAGFVGCVLLLVLYFIILFRGIKISQMARDDYGKLVACGIVAMIGFHIFVNIGMTLGLLPATGLPLPFMSYGGSFLLTMVLSVGMLMNIYAYNSHY